MKILFVHKNYPAQFGQIAHWLVKRGWDVTFATARKDVRSSTIRVIHFEDHREASNETHHYLTGSEEAVISGQGVVRAVLRLKRQGYHPDVVVAHSGWGVGLFVKDVWPGTKYVQYAEWYYRSGRAGDDGAQEESLDIDARARTRVRNAPFWLDFSAADATLCPTRYQASRFPQKIQNSITVLNDGFDTDLHCPGPRNTAMLDAQGIPEDARIVTYIARGMEPLRGFPQVMKTVALLQKSRRDIHFVIIADDRVAYGPRQNAPSWKNRMLAELDLVLSRLHFVGLVPRSRMIEYLRASSAHLYLSEPFILSWSFVEAMACAAPIVATRSPPVKEFMTDERTGLLVDPTVTQEVADAIESLVDDPQRAGRLGEAARSDIVTQYDANTIIFPRHQQFYTDLVNR
ncbi:MAG: glycosyltransferase [Pseudomonadota bacterium]